jgi:protoheme IX farnesyltransferase
MAHVIKKYILVTKPGVVLCNLISTAGGFFLGAKGEIDPGLMLATIVGTSLAVASGCVCNNCVDRKLDRSMARTQNRVMPKRLMSPTVAICYATLLGISGAVLLTAATGILCLAIVLAGFSIYVGLYSMILKRKSIYSTLVGSLAGAAPPLAGYCAVTQRFDAGAFILVLIFSLWQLPHAYAIGIFRINDYAAAAIPILPVKLGIRAAKVRIVGYILAFTTAASLLTVVGHTGIYYLTAAVAVGLSWLCVAWSGFSASDDRLWAKSLFILSIVSITLLSIMMAVDVTMPPRNLNHPPEQGIESARSFSTPHHGAPSRTMTLAAKSPVTIIRPGSMLSSSAESHSGAPERGGEVCRLVGKKNHRKI